MAWSCLDDAICDVVTWLQPSGKTLTTSIDSVARGFIWTQRNGYYIVANVVHADTELISHHEWIKIQSIYIYFASKLRRAAADAREGRGLPISDPYRNGFQPSAVDEKLSGMFERTCLSRQQVVPIHKKITVEVSKSSLFYYLWVQPSLSPVVSNERFDLVNNAYTTIRAFHR